MNGSSSSTQSEGPRTPSELACNICFRRMPNSPVAAYCGHVFCWPCLYQSWPQHGPGVQAGPAITKSCPVCGTALREGYNIVPIYGFDNAASPTCGTERPRTSTGTPIPPRPTEASYFTETRRRPSSEVIRARARAWEAIAAASAAENASNTAFPHRPTAVSSDTDIPPRPNPPSRITQTETQTQTDRALAPPARPLGPELARRLHNLASTIPRQGTQSELFMSGADDSLRPALISSSARNRARNSGLGVASRPIDRQRNMPSNSLRWNQLRSNFLRGREGNGGLMSDQAAMDLINEIQDDIEAATARRNALRAVFAEFQNTLHLIHLLRQAGP